MSEILPDYLLDNIGDEKLSQINHQHSSNAEVKLSNDSEVETSIEEHESKVDTFEDILKGERPEDIPHLKYIPTSYYRDPLIQCEAYQEMCKYDMFPGNKINDLLRLMEHNGKFDDLIISSGDFTYRKSKKTLIRLFHRSFKINEVQEIIRVMYPNYGEKIINDVLSPGKDFDDAYDFIYSANENDHNSPIERFRYRVNVSSFLENSGRRGLSVTMRRLTTKPLTLEQLGVDDFIIKHCTPKSGLVVVAGETGSGKSTLCAAIATKIRMDTSTSRLMLTYESPIEYILTEIDGPNPIRQSSVGEYGDFTCFYDGLRNALRRTPEVIYLGESRDKETFETLPKIAESGHMGLTTTHADSISSILTRIANEVGGDKYGVIRAIVNTAHLFIVQYLAKNGDDVVAVQERLLFTKEVKSIILGSSDQDLINTTRKCVEQYGVTMQQHAKELFNSGKIMMETYQHITDQQEVI